MGNQQDIVVMGICLAAVLAIAVGCAPRHDLPTKEDCDAVGGHWQTQSSADGDGIHFRGIYQWRCIPHQNAAGGENA